jgi:hypothetical protein
MISFPQFVWGELAAIAYCSQRVLPIENFAAEATASSIERGVTFALPGFSCSPSISFPGGNDNVGGSAFGKAFGT